MGEFADYFKEKKNLFNLLVLGILVLALPLGINLIRQQQILKSRAAVDPIVFTGDNVQKKADGSWVALKPQITLTLTSPLGPAVQTQTVKSENILMSLFKNGLVKTAYAGHTCPTMNTYCDGDQLCHDLCDPNGHSCDGPGTCPGSGGGGCPSQTCTYSTGDSSCASGITICSGSGASGSNQPGCTYTAGCSSCSCYVPTTSGCTNPTAVDGTWRYVCQSTACPTNPSQGVGVPWRCESGQWVNKNTSGECTASCSAPTSCPAGQDAVSAAVAQKMKAGDYLVDINIVGEDLKSYTGTGLCGYKYYVYKSLLSNGGACVTYSFGKWTDQTKCPTGACTVNNWTFSPTNPAPNTLFKASVTGVSGGSGWSNIAYKVDNGGWVTPAQVTVTGSSTTPTWTFDVNSGAAGTHTIIFGINKGATACTGTGSTGTFTTGTSGSTTCPADSNLTIAPSTANVGDTMVFQYKAGEDVFIGGDTWSGGIDEKSCQFDLAGRKYTCKTQSAVDNGIWQHRWNNKANCGSATYTIKGSGTTPPGTTTVSFRVAENPTDLDAAAWQPYTSHPMTGINFEFKDKTPGKKFVWVEFKDSSGKTERRSAEITLLGSGPEITGCSLSFEGNTTTLNLTGKNFGTDKGKVTSGTQEFAASQWKDTSIQAIWPNAPEGKTLDVTVTNAFGQAGPGQCSAIAQLSLGAKVFCRRPSDHATENVQMVLAGAFEGGTLVRQKVTIDKDGLVQGLTQKLEAGKQYKISLKAPLGLRKAASFTASSGTTNLPNFVLPIGDIFPIDGGDQVINSLDKSELNRQWIIAQAVINRTGDFNRDTRVNSIDWACMRYDFNVPNDPEPVVGAPSQSASSGTPSSSGSFSGTWSPFADANTFREFIFQSFGFTDAAKTLIKNNSTIEIKDLVNACGGGGFWMPADKKVVLNCTQYEAGLHELSHVWWHTYRLQNPEVVKSLVKDVVRLADGDGSADAVAFAKGYVNGIGSWKGMYCTDNGCADPHNIKDSDFDLTEAATKAKINDWEIYAGLSSWTMGKFKDGSHALPSYMWKYFELEFKGEISEKPYYEGGHP